MKETITYGLGALVLVASIGIFYSATNSDNEVSSCSVATNLTTKNDDKLYSKQSNSKTEFSKEKNKTIQVAKSKVKNTQNSSTNIKNKDEVQMPKEFESMEKELGSVKQEAIALLDEADNLLDSMNSEEQKLKQESIEAENILKEFEENNVIDVQAVKQEVEEMVKPIAIEDTPQEVKPILQRADKARLELEKKLTELKIIEKGE